MARNSWATTSVSFDTVVCLSRSGRISFEEGDRAFCVDVVVEPSCDYRKLGPCVTGFFEGRCGFPSAATVAMVSAIVPGVGVPDLRRRGRWNSGTFAFRFQSALFRQRLSGASLVSVV